MAQSKFDLDERLLEFAARIVPLTLDESTVQ
jgi:hypothetical protein